MGLGGTKPEALEGGCWGYTCYCQIGSDLEDSKYRMNIMKMNNLNTKKRVGCRVGGGEEKFNSLSLGAKYSHAFVQT